MTEQGVEKRGEILRADQSQLDILETAQRALVMLHGID
jgi:hypothetical protein